MTSISACVVTFNRQDEVSNCIAKLLTQSTPLTNILIYDNASTDETKKILGKLLSCEINGEPTLQNIATLGETNIWYYRASENSGGAGGFHYSVKLCHETFDSDYYWLMDDDGYPAQNCLELLMNYASKNNINYIMPVSIDIENHSQLSWQTRKKNGQKTSSYEELKESWGDVMNYITPFNGALLTRKCVSEVGYVNKSFFIWGDEYEHYWRCKVKGIQPITLTSAEFYHPAMKLPLVPIFGGMVKLPYVDSPLRMVCLVRNYTHIYLKYDTFLKIPVKFMLYLWFFIVVRKLDFSGLWLYIVSMYDGLVGNFERHKKYLKQ